MYRPRRRSLTLLAGMSKFMTVGLLILLIASIWTDRFDDLIYYGSLSLLGISIVGMVILLIKGRRTNTMLTDFEKVHRAAEAENRLPRTEELPPYLQEEIQMHWARKVLSRKEQP